MSEYLLENPKPVVCINSDYYQFLDGGEVITDYFTVGKTYYYKFKNERRGYINGNDGRDHIYNHKCFIDLSEYRLIQLNKIIDEYL